MSESFPPKCLLWRGSLLASIAHCIFVARAPLLASSQSWDGGAGVFSFGNDTVLGSSATDYLSSQEGMRDNTVTIIPTTAQQDNAALSYLRGYDDMNGVGLCDNCANRTTLALARAGIMTPYSFQQPGFLSPIVGPALPAVVSGFAQNAPGAQTIQIPRFGSSSIDLSRFNPNYSVPPR